MRFNRKKLLGKEESTLESELSQTRDFTINIKGEDYEIRDFFKLFDKKKLIYYQTLRSSLRVFFCNFRLSNLDLFNSNESDLGKAFKTLSKKIQPVSKILADAKIIVTHDELKNELDKHKAIVAHYPNLSTFVIL